MKTNVPSRRIFPLGLLLPVLAVMLLCTTARANDLRTETLEAIRQVENPRNLAKPGPGGELGAYQFRQATWAMHTARPFRDALNRTVSDEIAIAHYEWLRAGLLRNGLEVSTYNIALAWNAGLSAVVKGRVPNSARRYAERVTNLAQESRPPKLAST